MTSLFEQLLTEAAKPQPEVEAVRENDHQPKKKPSLGLKLPNQSMDDTRDKVAGIQASPEVDDVFANANFDDIDTTDEVDDETAAYIAQAMDDRPKAKLDITPRISSMLPKIIANAIAKVGSALKITTDPNDIDWHMVRHLPSYLGAPIRALGRQVFGPFTNTPIENIQVLANRS